MGSGNESVFTGGCGMRKYLLLIIILLLISCNSEVRKSAGESKCSFCGRKKSEVKVLIAGPESIFICDQCVELCSEIVAENKAREDNGPIPLPLKNHQFRLQSLIPPQQKGKPLLPRI